MKKPTKRTILIAAGASALIVGGAVAAVGAEVIDPYAIDPTQSETTITDELFSDDGEPVSTTVTTFDYQGNVIETSTTEH